MQHPLASISRLGILLSEFSKTHSAFARPLVGRCASGSPRGRQRLQGGTPPRLPGVGAARMEGDVVAPRQPARGSSAGNDPRSSRPSNRMRAIGGRSRRSIAFHRASSVENDDEPAAVLVVSDVAGVIGVVVAVKSRRGSAASHQCGGRTASSTRYCCQIRESAPPRCGVRNGLAKAHGRSYSGVFRASPIRKKEVVILART